VCGRIVARMKGRRVEDLLPGNQGRALFCYLVLHRSRSSSRDELMDALWSQSMPAAPDTALSALLTKLRIAIGEDAIMGKQDVRLVLPAKSWVDFEAANESLHRAEAAVAQGNWAEAWGPSRVALNVSTREFLPACKARWANDTRETLEGILVRAHECVASTGLGLSGSELASSERSARALTKLSPFRESGHRLLMNALAARGNTAEALLVYERLRRFLRDELGTAPDVTTQQLHRRLLQEGQGKLT
jgi:SARP family transcriptional regulator, regulator of embCAB operon